MKANGDSEAENEAEFHFRFRCVSVIRRDPARDSARRRTFLTASGTAFAEDGTAGSEAEDSDVDSEVEDAERYSHFREFEHTCLLLNRFCDSAFDYFKESCDKGYDEGCIMLSRMYGQGIKSEDINVEQDSSRAEELLKHSCSRSYSRLLRTCQALSPGEKIGDAIRTLGPTIELLKKECEEWDDDGSCVLLGDIYSEKWLNIDQDLKTSLSITAVPAKTPTLKHASRRQSSISWDLPERKGKRKRRKSLSQNAPTMTMPRHALTRQATMIQRATERCTATTLARPAMAPRKAKSALRQRAMSTRKASPGAISADRSLPLPTLQS